MPCNWEAFSLLTFTGTLLNLTQASPVSNFYISYNISFSKYPAFLTVTQNYIHSEYSIYPLLSISTASNKALVFSFPKLLFQNFYVSYLSIVFELSLSIAINISLTFFFNDGERSIGLVDPQPMSIYILFT